MSLLERGQLVWKQTRFCTDAFPWTRIIWEVDTDLAYRCVKTRSRELQCSALGRCWEKMVLGSCVIYSPTIVGAGCLLSEAYDSTPRHLSKCTRTLARRGTRRRVHQNERGKVQQKRAGFLYASIPRSNRETQNTLNTRAKKRYGHKGACCIIKPVYLIHLLYA